MAIVADHAILAEMLGRLLEQAETAKVVGIGIGADQALPLVAAQAPEVLVLGVMLPDVDGVAVARRVHAEAPGVAILLWTAFNLALARVPPDAGIRGCVGRLATVDDLLRAVRAVAASQPIFVGCEAQQDSAEPPLTPRERQVLAILVEGHGNAQIACLLDVSVKTVERHVSSLLDKLQVRSRTEAAVMATRRGWAGGPTGPHPGGSAWPAPRRP